MTYDPSKRYEISQLIQSSKELESQLEKFQDFFELYYINSLDENEKEYNDYSKEEHEIADSTCHAQWQLYLLIEHLESFATWYESKL